MLTEADLDRILEEITEMQKHRSPKPVDVEKLAEEALRDEEAQEESGE
jgi:hypothetical protein